MAKSKRGFASMSAEKQRELAIKGGHAAHAKGSAHEWTKAEASVAGKLGGAATRRKRLEKIAARQQLTSDSAQSK